uniref:Uncharacterized protein n=1 Tax=Noccaea caerulescens TaxID=107243 RepID=A0A1J3DR48_NOCCA
MRENIITKTCHPKNTEQLVHQDIHISLFLASIVREDIGFTVNLKAIKNRRKRRPALSQSRSLYLDRKFNHLLTGGTAPLPPVPRPPAAGPLPRIAALPLPTPSDELFPLILASWRLNIGASLRMSGMTKNLTLLPRMKTCSSIETLPSFAV